MDNWRENIPKRENIVFGAHHPMDRYTPRSVTPKLRPPILEAEMVLILMRFKLESIMALVCL